MVHLGGTEWEWAMGDGGIMRDRRVIIPRRHTATPKFIQLLLINEIGQEINKLL